MNNKEYEYLGFYLYYQKSVMKYRVVSLNFQWFNLLFNAFKIIILAI